jgi:hypothetical protein
MARYQHLAIFQTIYKLNLEINKRVENFPRLHRYSTGEKLKNLAFDLMCLVIKANSSKDKAVLIENAEEVLEKIKLSVRLCYDLKILGNKGFEYLVRLMDDIGSQSCKWKDWAIRQKPA